ncbi:hypothetical protein ABFS82_05G033600 [Erythranthe guttata]|nr:PREDICTED: geraniol 8-hydroxylase-like [Erythranthe guttata]|eukprot:XP_012846098.1 PREDICTED: geraniol 8-hydroxylase-like [Erythranthe guttata]
MDFVTISLALLFAVAVGYGLKKLSGGGKNLPPGPNPLPLIGSLHLLGDQPHKSLTRLSKIYGPIMHLRLGFVHTVLVSSAAMAKEVMQNHDLVFSGRTVPDAIRAHDHSSYSVIWLPVAARWRSLRKTINSNIFSGNSLEGNRQLRHKKVEELIEYCRTNSQSGTAVDVGGAAFRTSLNILSNTIFSRDLTDPFSDSSKEFKELIWNMMVEAGKPNLVDFFPLLRKFDLQGIRRRMTVHFGKVIDLFSDLIDERLEKMKSGEYDPTGDVIDVLLAAGEKNPEEIDRIHIERMCLDLFAAGTETTSSTVEWAMAEALKNPETMKRAKAELAEVIGAGKIVDEADIPRLPYLRCMLKETLRIHPPAPFLIPRRAERDVVVCGYTVPENSQVFVNAWAIGRDPEIWEEPLVFKPERFLESEVDFRGRDFELVPFGSGRRICPGLPLAARVLPVVVGSLLNSFDWKIEGGVTAAELNMDEKFGITLQRAHPLRAVPVPL